MSPVEAWGIPDPKKRGGVKDIKSKLLNPALTSLYYVTVGGPVAGPRGGKKFLEANMGRVDAEGLNLMCCEASLPGSSLATLDLTNDRTGVTEKHAYRRVYDDRIDLTFYVDAQSYAPIRYFETWIKYIAQETEAKRDGVGTYDLSWNYRFAYPDNYIDAQGLTITKFEKSSIGETTGAKGGTLKYTFIRSFPISISSMPVSYDSSSLLKCTVSMSYVRYLVDKLSAPTETQSSNTIPPQSLGAEAFQNQSLTDNFNTNIPTLINTPQLNTSYGQAAFNSSFNGNYFFQPQAVSDATNPQQATLATNNRTTTQIRQGR